MEEDKNLPWSAVQPGEAAFVHEPLDIPERKIRLLRPAGPIGDNDPLSFEISSWHIKTGPAYDAISYTWSPEDEAFISINGKAMRVRRNCFYALWQARRYRRLSAGNDSVQALWIDSICIDQSNDDEKSKQVVMMWDIYKHASSVLACIGPAADGSDRVMQAPLKKKSIPLTPSGYRAFCHRPYWERLWIAQELRAGGNFVVVLCGNASALWNDVKNFVDRLPNTGAPAPGKAEWTIKDGVNDEAGHTPIQLHYTLFSEIEFGDLFSAYKALRCQNPRDRIYGLLHCARIPKSLRAPDYSMPIWDLAKKASEFVPLSKMKSMLRALRIDGNHPIMRALVDASMGHNEKLRAQYFVGHSTSEENEVDILQGRVYFGPLSIGRPHAQMLSTLGQHQLGHPFEADQTISRSVHKSLRKAEVQGWYAGGKLIALLSSSIQIDRDNNSLFVYERGRQKLIFVLRWDHQALHKPEWQIVGQGVMMPNGSSSGDSVALSARSSSISLKIDRLTPEQKMCLAAQDIIGSEEEIRYSWFLLRVLSNVFGVHGQQRAEFFDE